MRIVATLTAVWLVALSAMFACEQNRDGPREPGARGTADAGLAPSASADAGRLVYAAQGCANCHSIAGQGNPRAPLDGVGRRRSESELRDWTLGTGPAATRLTARSLAAKSRYRALSADDIAALVAYLASLR